MDVDHGVFRIKAADGTVLAGHELSFRVDDFVFPIAADITGRTATIALGALGTLAGQLLVTAPVAIMAAAQYFTTINQPMPPAPAR